MTPLTEIGKRLDNITRYILDNHPQDKWVLSKIVPMFLEVIKSSTSIQEEKLIISQLDKLITSYELRYNILLEKKKADRCLRIARRKIKKSSAYRSGNIERCRQGDIWKDLKEIIDEVLQEDESLHKWFKRSGPKGKEGGWVDCNAPDGDGGYKACGRKEGEKRSKYPSCRPTAAQCKTPGKGKKWGKTK